MTFLCEGDNDMPDVMHERLSPGDGPPLHSHPWATWEVVINGRLTVQMGDDRFEVSAGDFVYTPPNIVHTFMAVGNEPAEVIAMNWPGGFQHLYREFDAIMNTGGEPDFAAMASAAEKRGATLHGPPLATLNEA